MNKLCLHAGGRTVDFDGLKGAERSMPVATDTHIPIPHHEFAGVIRDKIEENELEIVNEQHALARGDQHYFGIYQVVPKGELPQDYSMVIGGRNAHDKRFAAGVVSGSGVFICDNLAFSGDHVFNRKHTSEIMRDLPGLVDEGIKNVSGPLWDEQKRQIEDYKNYDLGDHEAHHLMIKALEEDVLAGPKLRIVAKEWRDPSFEDFRDRNLWSLFNAFTYAVKSLTIFSRADATQALAHMLNKYRKGE